MAALFGDAARVEDDDMVRVHQCRQAVADHDHRTIAPGVAQVQIYRLGGVSDGLATLADRWEADLTNPDRNSALFDVTRMYRLPLAELPDWLAGRATGDGQHERVRIRLFYRTIGEGGVTVDLRDTFEKDF